MTLPAFELGGDRSRPRALTAAPTRRLLYLEVIALVERTVVERGLAPGDMLPTQAELARLAGVSLITVRRALDELEQEGRVRRHQGLGTFLARPRIVSEPGRVGGLRETLGTDRPDVRLGTTILDVVRGTPSPDLASALALDAALDVWRLRRLRHVDGQPMVVDLATIPVHLAHDLDERVSRAEGSLYELLERDYGLVDEYEEQYLQVVAPGAEERRLLRLAPRAQAVRIQGVSFAKDGTPFDAFQQVYPAADFAFAIAGSTSRRLVHGGATRDMSIASVRPVPPGAASSALRPGHRER